MLLLSVMFSMLISCQREVDETLDTDDDQDLDPVTLIIKSFIPNEVKLDDTVSIKGAGFDGVNITANKLTVDGISVPVLFDVTDTTIKFKVTENLTSGKIGLQVGAQSFTTSDILTIISDINVEPEEWKKQTDFPYAATGDNTEFYSAFSLNTKGYYLNRNRLWEYDSAANSWTEKAKLPGDERNYNFSFVINNKAYVGLGTGSPGEAFGPMDRKVWEYNPSTNIWSEKSGFPGDARVAPFSFSVGTKGYVGGGDKENNGTGFVKDFWEYNSVNDTWKQLKDFSGDRAIGLTGVSTNSEGYVFELGYGNPTAAFGNYTNVFLWKYNVAGDSWEKLSSVPSGSTIYSSGTAVLLNNAIYVGLGSQSSTTVNGEEVWANFWKYDLTTKTWLQKPDIGGGVRHFPIGFVVGKSIYMGLGTGETFDATNKDFWRFTPNN